MYEYSNKPYWSIVSPCSSCPETSEKDDYVATTITNIKVEKYDDSIIHLPTAKEYEDVATKTTFQSTNQWSEPKYQCPICNGEMRKNLNIALLTCPPQYTYRCNRCGYIEHQYI